MADEPNTTSSTTTPPPTQVLGNDTTARNQDGSLKDNQAPPTTDKPATATDSKPDSLTSKASTPAADKPTDKPTSTGAPEAYAEFKAPEGFEIDKEAIAAALPIFKELNITQEGAQKLVDFYAAQSKDAAEAPYKQWETLRNEWRDTVIKDPALGDGKGGLKPEVNAVIGRAIDALDPAVAKGFREALVLTGAGDNPAFVKAFYNLATMLGEGTLVRGGGPSPAGQTSPNAPRSAAAAMYPNLPSSSNAR